MGPFLNLPTTLIGYQLVLFILLKLLHFYYTYLFLYYLFLIADELLLLTHHPISCRFSLF